MFLNRHSRVGGNPVNSQISKRLLYRTQANHALNLDSRLRGNDGVEK